MIVEDCAPLRGIIRRILEAEKDLHVIGEAADGQLGCQMLQHVQPNVLVTDLLLPACSGSELIRYARDRFPKIAIVAVSIERDEPYIQSAFENGALGFVHKSHLHEHLAEAVRSVTGGERFLRLP